MVKCPFCQFNNEDGALFCEQCKSDLSQVEPVGPPAAKPVAGHEAIPMAMPLAGDAIPLAGVEAYPVQGGFFPEAQMIEAVPVPVEGGPSTFAIPGLATPVEPVAVPANPVSDMPTQQFGTFEPLPPIPPEPPHVHEAAPIWPEPPAPPVPPVAPVVEPVVKVPEKPAEPAPVAPAAGQVLTPPVSPEPAKPAAAALPPGAQPKLVVMRGQRPNVEYPIYDGLNFIGRSDEKPVDIDLEDQEPPDRIWSSRQHALITFEEGTLAIEDLNSSNGTFVNRTKIYPGQKRPLNVNDVVQIGTVQMKLKVT
jgi:hypothetical protein